MDWYRHEKRFQQENRTVEIGTGTIARDRAEGVFFEGFFLFFTGSAVTGASERDNCERV